MLPDDRLHTLGNSDHPPIYERAYAARPLHFKFTFFTTKLVPTLMGFIVGLYSFSSAASKAFFSQHHLLARGATIAATLGT